MTFLDAICNLYKTFIATLDIISIAFFRKLCYNTKVKAYTMFILGGCKYGKFIIA